MQSPVEQTLIVSAASVPLVRKDAQPPDFVGGMQQGVGDNLIRYVVQHC